MKNSNFLTSKISQFKGIIAGAALCIIAISAQAQDFPGTSFGIKGGLNLTNFTKNDNVTDEKIRAGFHAGVYGRFKLVDGFSLQPEVVFSTQGNKQTNSNAFGSMTTTRTLGYVQIPVLAVVNIIPYFNIHAGPYLGFLVSNNINNISQTFIGGSNNTYNYDNDTFNKVDYGLQGGLGIDITKFHVGARYLYGLQNISSNTNNPYYNLKNNGIQLYVALDLK